MNIQSVTTNQSLYTSNDLSKSIVEKIEELAHATDVARMNQEMVEYLETCSRFHQYSPYNVFCILLSFPQATQVAGFHRWKSLNRYIRKGQKGIPILAPIMVLEDPYDPKSNYVLRGFKVVRVFDVSQTEGEPLPEPPNWKSTEKNKELENKLIKFAHKNGIQVSIIKQALGIQGVSKGGAIEVDPSAGTKTLIHEIAHELMHRDEDRPNESTFRELEAESVAFVVSRHFGLDVQSSPNYIVLHGATSEMIMCHLKRIRKTACEIITEIESERNIII